MRIRVPNVIFYACLSAVVSYGVIKAYTFTNYVENVQACQDAGGYPIQAVKSKSVMACVDPDIIIEYDMQ